MNFDSANLFQLASRRLQWLSDRQKVVSENIANADVSGYRARDVQSFSDYLDKGREAGLAPDAEVIEVESSWGRDLSGNNVILEEQMVLAADTAGQYRIASNLYRKAQQMILAVASGR
jgi:flagellar basal-body rod protein FlgB